MNIRLLAFSICVSMLGLVFTTVSSAVADGNGQAVLLPVKNATNRPVTFWIIAEAKIPKGKEGEYTLPPMNQWVRMQIFANQTNKVNLVSPDKFIFRVEWTDSGFLNSFTSDPIAFKELLAEHPKSVLRITAERIRNSGSQGSPESLPSPNYHYDASAVLRGDGGKPVTDNGGGTDGRDGFVIYNTDGRDGMPVNKVRN